MKSALRWLWKLAPWLLAGAVVLLLAQQARSMEWAKVGTALQSIPLTLLAAAAGMALLSHALVSSYDLIGRHIVGHSVGPVRTVSVAAICYAFNLNFGALVGGMALRLRLYTRLGLQAGTVAQVIAFSMLTNWLGYGLLMGGLLLLWPPTLPASLPLPTLALQIAGGLMTALSLAYLLACGFSRKRSFAWREHRLELPSGRLALLQAGVSSLNWLLMSTIIWTLLGGRIDFGSVATSLLLAAVAGVITHVPAGLGVLEAVFIATSGSAVSQPELLAALLAYRAVYYLIPLLWAVPGYLVTEAGAGKGEPSEQPAADRAKELKPG